MRNVVAEIVKLAGRASSPTIMESVADVNTMPSLRGRVTARLRIVAVPVYPGLTLTLTGPNATNAGIPTVGEML